jgi:hypothetical protein
LKEYSDHAEKADRMTRLIARSITGLILSYEKEIEMIDRSLADNVNLSSADKTADFKSQQVGRRGVYNSAINALRSLRDDIYADLGEGKGE